MSESTNLKAFAYGNSSTIKMSSSFLCIICLFFTIIIVASNYLVGFRIGDSHITYGALSYPIIFLAMDILSEKYNRSDILKCLQIAPLLAFFPSLYIVENIRIAIASVSAFLCSQMFDVFIFCYLKKRFPRLWWFRSGASTNIAQIVDTVVFFHIAFLFMLPYYDVFMMASFDYIIKSIVAVLNIPIFYLIAIKTYKKIKL